MTTATVNGRRVQMTIAEKAALLQVVDVHEAGLLAVVSGSDPRVAYAVYHNGQHVTSCACTGCKHHGRTACAYRLAAQRKLNERRRDFYCETFNIYN